MIKLEYHNITGADVNVGPEVGHPLDKGLSGFAYPELGFTFDKDLNEIRRICKNRHEYETFEYVAKDQTWVLDYVNEPDTFKVNSLLFRSDEFTKNHDGKHILFSGCSNTYGFSLYNHEIWPWLLYNKIKEKEKVSGYYNLAIPGTGAFSMVSDIFKYINNYSKPDVIFINLPLLSRFYSLVNDTGSSLEFDKEINLIKKIPTWHHSIPITHDDNVRPSFDGSTLNKPDEKYHPIIAEKFIHVYQYLMMLETFCKINNIQLYVFSHNLSTNWFLSQTDLHSFKNISATMRDVKMAYELMLDYMSLNKNDKFSMQGRDKIHEGTSYHYAWSELAYSWYKNNNY
jgi:hypothetical protein